MFPKRQRKKTHKTYANAAHWRVTLDYISSIWHEFCSCLLCQNPTRLYTSDISERLLVCKWIKEKNNEQQFHSNWPIILTQSRVLQSAWFISFAQLSASHPFIRSIARHAGSISAATKFATRAICSMFIILCMATDCAVDCVPKWAIDGNSCMKIKICFGCCGDASLRWTKSINSPSSDTKNRTETKPNKIEQNAEPLSSSEKRRAHRTNSNGNERAVASHGMSVNW